MTQTQINRLGVKVLTVLIDAMPWNETLKTIERWAIGKESRYICICNVHSVVTGYQDSAFSDVLNNADMATPDGMPIAWMLRRMGFKDQQRINGPDLMWRYCQQAENSGQSVYFYGNTDTTLLRLTLKIRQQFPRLNIAGQHSPPFRTISEEEDNDIINAINASGAGVVFVSLGCPKQEIWMADHRGKINAVMIGVGAAFDYHAGTIRRAPKWMQEAGLEWAYRLLAEPKRLWRRYFATNSIFIFQAVKQLIRTASSR